MLTYEDVINDETIIQLYRLVDEKTNYVVSLGMRHINSVVKNAKNIAAALKLDERESRLLLIASVLHDIGRLDDNYRHEMYSALRCESMLMGEMEEDDLSVVLKCIRNHNYDYTKLSEIENLDLCLMLADKLDFSFSRLNEKLMYQAESANYNLYKFTKSVDVYRKDNELVVEVTVLNDEGKSAVEFFSSSYKFLPLIDEIKSRFKLNKISFIIQMA